MLVRDLAVVAAATLGFVAGANGATAQSKWRPLDLVTSSIRAKATSAEIKLLIDRVSNRRLSYRERAAAARMLAGVSEQRATQCLVDAIIEPRQSKEVWRLRAACAEALKWRAAAGDGLAIKALYDALVAEDTYVRSGTAIMKAILDSRGAAEVIDTVSSWLVAGALPGDGKVILGRNDAPLNALFWANQTTGACHFGPRTNYAKVMRETNRRLAEKFRRMSPTRMESIVSRSSVLEMISTWSNAPGGNVLVSGVVRGLPNRSPSTQETVAKWLVEGGSGFLPERLHARLDESCIRNLWNVAPRLPANLAAKTRTLVGAICHGEEAAVLAGKRRLADVVLDAIDGCKPLEVETQGAPGVGPPRIDPWLQLALLPVRIDDAEAHPYLGILRDESRPLRERVFAAEMLTLSVANDSPRHPEKLQPFVEAVLASHKRGEDRFESPFYATTTTLLVCVSPEKERAKTFFSTLRLRDAHPFDQALALTVNASWAYRWMRQKGPDRMANEVVGCFERAVSRKNKYVHRIGYLLLIALRHLTPETLPPVRGLPPGEPPGPESWNADVAAAWRAWFERFRKLPVFSKARAE